MKQRSNPSIYVLSFFVLIGVLLINEKLAAQFASVGDVWHYNELTPDRSYSFYKCERDTIIQGRQVSKLAHLYFGENSVAENKGSQYLTEHRDTVFYYRADKNKFEILFYPANIRDTMLLKGPNDSNPEKVYVVDSSTINYAGQLRKVWTLETKMESGIKYIEGIGYSSMLLPSWTVSYPTVYTHVLRCFNGERYVEFRSESVCDKRWLMSSQTGEMGSKLFLFPNPASTMISIQGLSPTVEYSIKLFDLTGTVVHEHPRLSGAEKVDVSNLERGMYLVQNAYK